MEDAHRATQESPVELTPEEGALVRQLEQMGFTTTQSEQSIRATTGGTVEDAAEWILNHPEEAAPAVEPTVQSDPRGNPSGSSMMGSMNSTFASAWAAAPSMVQLQEGASVSANASWEYAQSWWVGAPEKPKPELKPSTHAAEAVDVDRSLPVVTVQLVTIDGRRVKVEVNATHRISQLKMIANGLAPVSPGMRMRLFDFRGQELTDPSQTVEQADLAGTAVRCDAYVGPAGVLIGW